MQEQPRPGRRLGRTDVRATGAYVHADLSNENEHLALLTPTDSPLGSCHPADRSSPSPKPCNYVDTSAAANPERDGVTCAFATPRPVGSA